MKKTKTNHLHLASHGFSLVEIMLGLGLLSVITLGTTQLISTQTKHVSNLDDSFEAINLQKEITQAIGHLETCNNNLIGLTSGDPVNEIIGKDGELLSTLFANDQKFKKLTIKSMIVGEMLPASEGKKVYLDVTILKGQHSLGGNQLLKRIPFFVKTNEENEITECLGSENQMTVLARSCYSIGGDFKNGQCQFNDQDLQSTLNLLMSNQAQFAEDISVLQEQMSYVLDQIASLNKIEAEQEVEEVNPTDETCNILSANFNLGRAIACHMARRKLSCQVMGGSWLSLAQVKESNIKRRCTLTAASVCSRNGGAYNSETFQCLGGQRSKPLADFVDYLQASDDNSESVEENQLNEICWQSRGDVHPSTVRVRSHLLKWYLARKAQLGRCQEDKISVSVEDSVKESEQKSETEPTESISETPTEVSQPNSTQPDKELILPFASDYDHNGDGKISMQDYMTPQGQVVLCSGRGKNEEVNPIAVAFILSKGGYFGTCKS